MKIKQMNAGVLTNFEVVNFLRSRGATSDPLGCLGAVAPSECKVFDFLLQTAARSQTTEAINEFLRRSEKYKLAKAERLNIINLRPSTQAEIYAIVEECEKRLARDEDQGIDEVQELVDLVVEILPPPPMQPEVKPEEDADDQDAMQS